MHTKILDCDKIMEKRKKSENGLRNFKQRVKFMTKLALLVMLFSSCDTEEQLPVYQYESIAVYGGSVSSTPESNYAKSFWQEELNIPVFTYGVGGAGFTSGTVQPNIPAQIEQSPMHKIAVIWCSTNDVWAPIENDDKYSPYSQNGGMRTAIEKLKARDPDCIILGFCSLPAFDGRNMADHVEGQIEVFEEYGIPYLNQFGFFTEDDVVGMYKADKLHHTHKGYISIRERQVEFLRENITR